MQFVASIFHTRISKLGSDQPCRSARNLCLAANHSPLIESTTFVLTAYLLLITEAIGTYVGVHFLWTAKETSSKAVKT